MAVDSSNLILFTKDLGPEEKELFFSQYESQKKKIFWGYFWLLLTGFLHKFYLGEILWGIIFTSVFVISLALFFIPITLLVLWDLFFLKGKIKRYNRNIAEKIISDIYSIRS